MHSKNQIIEKQIKLYKEAFPEDSKKYVDYFFSSKIKEALVIYDTDHDSFKSLLYLFSKQAIINDQSFNIPFIVAAATFLEHRGREIFKKVMIKTLKKLQEENIPFCALYPFKHSYYKKYDFITSDYVVKSIISYSVNSAIRYSKTTNITEIVRIYKEAFKDITIILKRDLDLFEKRMSELISEDGNCYTIYQNNIPVAYFMLSTEITECASIIGYEIFNNIDILDGQTLSYPTSFINNYSYENSMVRITCFKSLIDLLQVDYNLNRNYTIYVTDEILKDRKLTTFNNNGKLALKDNSDRKQQEDIRISNSELAEIILTNKSLYKSNEFFDLFSVFDIFLIDKY